MVREFGEKKQKKSDITEVSKSVSNLSPCQSGTGSGAYVGLMMLYFWPNLRPKRYLETCKTKKIQKDVIRVPQEIARDEYSAMIRGENHLLEIFGNQKSRTP